MKQWGNRVWEGGVALVLKERKKKLPEEGRGGEKQTIIGGGVPLPCLNIGEWPGRSVASWKEKSNCERCLGTRKKTITGTKGKVFYQGEIFWEGKPSTSSGTDRVRRELKERKLQKSPS